MLAVQLPFLCPQTTTNNSPVTVQIAAITHPFSPLNISTVFLCTSTSDRNMK